MGGTPSEIGTGTTLIVGEPVYMSASSVMWGVPGEMVLSYGDSTKPIGWLKLCPLSGNNFNGTGLCIHALRFP